MRRSVLLSFGIGLLSTALGIAHAHGQQEEQSEPEHKALNAIAPEPPSSLDALFPPQAEQPVFLFRMLGMAAPFSGIVADLFEADLEHAQANFEKFKMQYVEISRLVPEWEKNYPMGPVEALGAALETGNQAKVMAAYESVGKVCHDCHTAYMPKVQQKYHGGDFHAVRVNDPLTDEEVDFAQLMRFLDANFAGIIVDVEQGQRENAQLSLGPHPGGVCQVSGDEVAKV